MDPAGVGKLKAPFPLIFIVFWETEIPGFPLNGCFPFINF